MLDKFRNYADKGRLDYDLTFLYGLRKRIPLQGNGPRHLLLSNNKLIIPTYFADVLKNKKERSTLMMRDIVIRGGKVVTDVIPETAVRTV